MVKKISRLQKSYIFGKGKKKIKIFKNLLHGLCTQQKLLIKLMVGKKSKKKKSESTRKMA